MDSSDTLDTDLDAQDGTLIRPVIRAYSMNGLESVISKNMESLLTEKELHDVQFVVGQEHEKQQVFYGIRALFAVHSPVLRRMLYGSMMESQLETKILINDCTVESFRFLQRFFYGLNPILNESIIVDILYVSKKYLITSLELGCVEYISSITDIEAVLTILSQLYNLSLIDVCLNILSQHQVLQNQSDEIWNSQRLVSVPKEIIIKLLQLSCADMKEEVIWESCIEWSKHQALKYRNQRDKNASESVPWPLPSPTIIPYSQSMNNLRDLNISAQYKRIVVDDGEWKKHITDLLPFIRFPLMGSKYFVHKISKLGVLTDKQIIGVMTYYLDNAETGNLSFSYLRRINEFSFNIYCPKYGFVSDSGRTIKVTNNRKKCLFSSSTTWNYGIHRWKYKIFECYVIAVGIITDYKICNEPDRTLLDSSLSYFNSCGGDCCIVEEQKLDDLAKVEQWGEGDAIDIELNCNNWTLKFGKNGTQMGKTISIKKNQLYHPVLASVGKNKVTVTFY